ncbi:MAG: NUDIX domain-containing protein [Thermoleophilia bacterium]|nr:NUDIX domain-containing protein [Thermoleophilia bacterium]
MFSPGLDLGVLQDRAAEDGRRAVVGALVVDVLGRAFVDRRGWDRSFLPGCWDIVGGHVEPGEALLAALAREVEEETGWQVVGNPALAYVADWEWAGEGRREFDFLVGVEGDLAHPRLELPRHVESRWVGKDDLGLLDENRGQDGGLVRRLVELALTQGPSWHLTAFLEGAVAARVEELRRVWDPAMAMQIAAHVTVAYPVELGDQVPAVAGLAPFRLSLGAIAHWEAPEGGVYVAVEDLDGGWTGAREFLPRLSADRLDVRPHVTVVHPRTTNRGPAAWKALKGGRLDGESVVRELAITAFDGRCWLTVETFPLSA